MKRWVPIVITSAASLVAVDGDGRRFEGNWDGRGDVTPLMISADADEASE